MTQSSFEALLGYLATGEGEDAPSEARSAIAMRLWNTADNFNVSLVDADHWKTEILGRRLSRREALASPWKQEAFDLSDHIVECDWPIVDYLNSHIRGG